MKATKQVCWGSIPVAMDQLSLKERLFITASLIGVLVLSFPHITFAHTINTAPLVFEVNELGSLGLPHENYLAEFLVPDKPLPPPDPRLESLQQYLESRNSPLAQNVQVLLEQYHYRLIIGISFAESNFCKTQIRPNNCWGIGGGSPETYPNLTHGIIRANELIQKYHEQGMTTPKFMRDTWVGWRNDNWVIAVNQITEELEERGL